MNQYKFLNERDGKIVSQHGDHIWTIGTEYSVQGTVKACSNGFHSSKQPLDALYYVKGEILAVVEGSGDADHESDKSAFRTMKIVKAYRWTTTDSVLLAVYAAEQVLKIYEDEYPDDTRPRDAIKAATAYLKEPNARADAARAAAADAAYARADAARAADAAAAYAADADAAAADADAAAAYAAARAARAARAAYAAYAAAAADAYAAYAADAARAAAYADAAPELTAKINRWIKSHIKKLEQIDA